MLRKLFFLRPCLSEWKAGWRNRSSRWSDYIPTKLTVHGLYCIGLLSLVCSSSGCTMCCSPDDWNYGAYGGRWQRHDPSHGRVSSAFAEAGYDSLGDVIDAAITPEPELLPGDDHIHPASYNSASDNSVSSYIE